MSLPAAFAAKTRTATCTVWVGACNTAGYGVLAVDGRLQLAHRVSYEAAHGPIPPGMVLDHLCRVRNCVRVEHLELVTYAENSRRGRSAASLQVGDTCSNGHHIATPAALYIRPSGLSECRQCRNAGKRANRAGMARPTRQKRAATVAAAHAS